MRSCRRCFPKSTRCSVITRSCLAVVLLVLGLLLCQPAWAQPAYLPLGKIKLEIVKIRLVKQVNYQDGRWTVKEEKDKPPHYIAIVTVKVTKPANEGLTIATADLTLHYNHKNGYDVAPCDGISNFSKNIDDDRSLHITQSKHPGCPMWQKTSTGAGSKAAGEFYFEAAFGNMEGDVKEAWLFLGQPASTQAKKVSAGDYGQTWP